MDFAFSESENILLNSAKNFLQKEARNLAREVEKTNEGYSPAIWKKIAELGWFGIVFPEEYGGIEGSFFDLVLLIEEMGKFLFPGPFIETVISGLSILEYGNETQKVEYLSRLIEGNLILSPALIKPDIAVSDNSIEEHVSVKGGKYVLNGTKLLVPYGHKADFYLYSAETDNGETLFLINSRTPGITCTVLESIAADRPCEVNFDGVEVSKNEILGQEGQGDEIVGKIGEWGALAQCAFITGMLEQVLKMSVAYAMEREQFGRQIGSFQAIQHQCADMATDINQVKFLTYEAAWKLSSKLTSGKEISMAKAWASDASRRVCLLGVKIHGGTGVSEEHDMQLYFRRAKAAELAFGDGDFHREVVAQELGL